MTDMLNRPKASTTGPGAAGRPALPAAVAAVAAAGATWAGCLAVAVVGWFLADGGAHGDTTDALGAGSRIWLAGHGAGVALAGVPVGLLPLGLTVALGAVALRLARWSARGLAPGDAITAAGVFATAYLIVAVLLGVLLGGPESSLPRLILGALAIGATGALGILGATGRLGSYLARVPGWVRAVLEGALAAAALMLATGALVVLVGLVLGFNEAAAVYSALRLSTGEGLSYTVLSGLFTPNAALFGAAYLLGSGFAVGTGTVVSPTVVELGPVPAFPLLAALPGEGVAPSWLIVLLAVPVLAGATAAGLTQRRYAVVAWDSAALRGFGVGLGGALVLTAMLAAASGSVGTGRLSSVGPLLGESLVAGVIAMSLGGLVGGLVVAGWQRRRR